jgi:FtsP/CotA-like multicopper oxidase with cupredoxin domain
MNQRLSRRGFLKLGLGAAAGAAGAQLFLSGQAGSLTPTAQAAAINPLYFLAGTDGWISLPGTGNSQFYPDPLAGPLNKTTYIFGFANVTSMLNQSIGAVTAAFKNGAQACAPLMYFDELDRTQVASKLESPYVVRLTNLGLQQRPDLIDSHTVHWHGFRDAIPMFDGEPSSSIAVPIGRTFDYAYAPFDAGTYMYHCHFEDTEHVHMGMTGPIFVRPKQNRGVGALKASRVAPQVSTLYTPNLQGPMGYAYNDGDGSTAYDREYVIFLSEVWNESHWDDAHIQLPDWTSYKADFFLMNGRVYPDTLLGNGVATGSTGLSLDKQPYTSLIQCNANERVLLRFINLGYTKASMTLSGIKMKVVGMDAVLLRGRTGADGSYATNTIQIGPGESVDAIFTAPSKTGSGYDTYPLYNRNAQGASNNGNTGLGGQATEVRVFNGTLTAQQKPNDL